MLLVYDKKASEGNTSIRPHELGDGRGPMFDKRNGRSMRDFWVEKGWYVVKDGEVVLKRADWSDRETRRQAFKFLADEVLGKDPKELKRMEVVDNGQGSVLVTYHAGDLRQAMVDAFPDMFSMPEKMHIDGLFSHAFKKPNIQQATSFSKRDATERSLGMGSIEALRVEGEVRSKRNKGGDDERNKVHRYPAYLADNPTRKTQA